MLWWTLRQLKADDWRAREGAARTLGELRDARAVDALVAALRDKNPTVRTAAEDALVQIGSAAVRPLISAVKKQPEIRAIAKEALIKIGQAATAPLGGVLFDKDLAVRETAAAALGKIGDTGALEQLLAALKHGDFGAKEAAAAGLVRVGHPAIAPLIAALKDNKTRTRDTAAAALVRIGNPAVEPLIAVLQDGDVREVALEALAKIDPQWPRSRAARAAAPTFMRCLTDGDDRMRRAAATFLGEIGDPAAVEPLVGAVLDSNDSVQEAALTALGAIGDPRALLPLAAALKNPEPRCRAAAAAAFVQIGKRLVDPLIANLKAPDPNIREAAAAVLVRIGNSTVQPLVEVLWQIDPQFGKTGPDSVPAHFIAAVRADAVMAAKSSSGEPRAKQPQSRVIKAAKQSRQLPFAAVAAEPQRNSSPMPIDPSCDVDALSMALDHPDPDVRSGAAKNLIQFAYNLDQPLVHALKTGNAPARRAAAHALAVKGDLRARESLRADLSDPNPIAVLDAADALVRLGDLNVVLGLISVLRSVWKPSDDPARLHKAERAFRLLHRLLECHAKDLPLDELHAVSEFPKKTPFVSSASAALAGADPVANPNILPESDNRIDCTILRELATRELLRRKLKP